MTEINEIAGIISAGKNLELESNLKDNPSLADAKTAQGISLLQFSIYCRNQQAVELLRPLKKPDVFEAASLGDLPVVQNEISKNPDLLNAFAADGFTALGLACFFGQHSVAAYLLKTGADPGIPSNNSFNVAPIHSSCAISSFEITDLLLRHGAKVNAKQQMGVTPLHETAHNGKMELTRLLIENGADLNAKTEHGQSPLDMALEKGFTEVASLLKKHGGK